MRQSKIIVLIVYMLLMVHTSFSQINMDSLLQPQSNLYLIDKARSLLIDAFIQSDKQKVQELHRYLSEDFDQNNYLTLFPDEQILLCAWLGDFENMLRYIKEYHSTYINMHPKIMPTNNSYQTTNNFYQTIKTRVQQDPKVIFDNLRASSLTQEEKDFAAIYLHYYLIFSLSDSQDSDAIVRKINTNTRAFIETYPHSEYIKLFNNYELKPANWGFGMGVEFGYSMKTGDFYKYFKNGGLLGLYVDVAYKKFMITTGYIVSYGKIRESMRLSEGSILQKNTSENTVNGFLSLGYKFFNEKRLIIIPVAGIGTAHTDLGSFKERKNNPALERLDYTYGLTANFGIMTDVRLATTKKLPGQNFVDPSFYAIRLSYKFWYNNLTSKPIIYNGNLHTITIGFNFFSRKTNRVKY